MNCLRRPRVWCSRAGGAAGETGSPTRATPKGPHDRPCGACSRATLAALTRRSLAADSRRERKSEQPRRIHTHTHTTPSEQAAANTHPRHQQHRRLHTSPGCATRCSYTLDRVCLRPRQPLTAVVELSLAGICVPSSASVAVVFVASVPLAVTFTCDNNAHDEHACHQTKDGETEGNARRSGVQQRRAVPTQRRSATATHRGRRRRRVLQDVQRHQDDVGNGLHLLQLRLDNKRRGRAGSRAMRCSPTTASVRHGSAPCRPPASWTRPRRRATSQRPPAWSTPAHGPPRWTLSAPQEATQGTHRRAHAKAHTCKCISTLGATTVTSHASDAGAPPRPLTRTSCGCEWRR